MKIDLPGILRAVVRSPSTTALGQSLAERLAESRSVVLARVWVDASDDAFALVGSAGTPSGGGSYTRLDGEFREMAISDGKIREIASARAPLVVRGLRGDEDWLTNSAWAARQGVRAFLALPLIADDDVVGLVAAFDRDMPDADLLSQLALVADIAAHRLAELRTRPEDLPSPPSPSASTKVLTRAELRRMEKESIEAALERTQGIVFGTGGAATLLGMRPTTLASRIKALGIGRIAISSRNGKRRSHPSDRR